MSLEEEIRSQRAQIHTTVYQMSIGELISLYRDEEIEIHPEFQRLYRWSHSQKCGLIESLFLNIPIPPIFVSQNANGIWDVIDGVQRLSTIFEFVGVYKNEEGNTLPSLELSKTAYLPSFEGKTWENEDSAKSLTREQRLDFKRLRIDIIIINKESDTRVKYDLFQRINTGGSRLSAQEVRNCLMVMMNNPLYSHLSYLSKDENFVNCIAISDRKEDEQYPMELILKLIIGSGQYSTNYSDLCELLDKETMNLCENRSFDLSAFEYKFKKTFSLLNGAAHDNVFKKWKDNKFSGAFLSSSYQCIAIGVFYNLERISELPNSEDYILSKIKSLYSNEKFNTNMRPGASPLPRFNKLSELGKQYFSE